MKSCTVVIKEWENLWVGSPDRVDLGKLEKIADDLGHKAVIGWKGARSIFGKQENRTGQDLVNLQARGASENHGASSNEASGEQENEAGG